jgi:peptidase A4-like protein
MLARLRIPALTCIIGAIAIAAVLLALAGPAQAATHGKFTRGPAIPRAGALSVTNSRIFAGYVAAVPVGAATSVTASFTVPALSCAPPDLGIFATAGESVNRNLLLTAAGVAIKCESDKAVYFPALVINGVGNTYRSSPFAAGDVINLSASVTTTATTVTVTDVTKNVTKTLTGAGARPRAAFIGDDAIFSNAGILLGVPNFGKLKFTSCMINSQALESASPQEFQRVNHSGVVQIATGPFSPPGGLAFATYYRHQ